VRILKTGEVWKIESSYQELDQVKAVRVNGAGAWWHGLPCSRPRCPACAAHLGKTWWTSDPQVAAAFGFAAEDDATRRGLEAIVGARREAIDASRAASSDAILPAPPGLEYMPFQRAGITYAMTHPNVLFGDEMGLGKTIQAIGLLNTLPEGEARRVLVVCPASLRVNWQRELQRWSIRPLRIGIVEGSRFPEGDLDVVIINYDVLTRHLPVLSARQWNVLIADEAHYAKNSKAQRTKALLAIPARRKVALTGTPICNRPSEFWSLAHWLAPAEFTSWKRYGDRYCAPTAVWTGSGMVTTYTGAANLEELQARARGSFMVRRLKSEVLTELPAKRRQIIPLAWNGASAAVKRLNAEWEAREAKVATLRVAALGAATDEEYKEAVKALSDAEKIAFEEISTARRELAIEKCPKAIEHISDLLDEERKVCVFAHHHAVVKLLAEGLAEFKPVVLTGETSMRDRQAAVDSFQNDPNVRVFIGSIMAAGVGLTLTAASTAVFVELDWVPGNVTQAEDRLHRIGQTAPVLIQHLVFDDSLDSHLAKVLVEKQEVIDRALDKGLVLPELAALAADPLPAKVGVPRAFPSVSPDLRAAVHEALAFLAAHCDGARTQDGMGFNRMDAAFGRQLALLSTLTDRQALAGQRVIRKYRAQLGAELAARAGVAGKEE